MYFVNSNGNKVKKELIIGAIQYTDNSTSQKTNGNSQKELKGY